MFCVMDASTDVRAKDSRVRSVEVDVIGSEEGVSRIAEKKNVVTRRRSASSRPRRTRSACFAGSTQADDVLAMDPFDAVEMLDPEAERQSLLQKMEVLNKMLSRVADEESEQLAAHGTIVYEEIKVREGKDGVLGEERNGSMYSSYSTLEEQEWLAGSDWDADQENDGLLHLPSHGADLFMDATAHVDDRPTSGSRKLSENPKEVARDQDFDGWTLEELKEEYKKMYKRTTSSTNRQWLLRRLSQGVVEKNEAEGDAENSALEGDQHDSTAASNGARPEGKRRIRQNPRYSDFREARDSKEDKPVQMKKLRSGTKRAREESSEGNSPNTPSESEGDFKIRRSRSTQSLPPTRTKTKQSVLAKKNSQKKSVSEGQRRRTGTKKSSWGQEETRRLHYNPWTLEESEALVDGVACCGGGKWADIKKLGYKAIENRSAVDLKDKWRNLMRIALLPQNSNKAVDKKREIPPSLLARVRELAARSARKTQGPEVRPSRSRSRGE